MSSSAGTVWVVHCVDTEGPLEETVAATFERLNARFATSFEPSLDTLAQLQRSEIDLAGIEPEVAKFLAPARLAYLSTWRDVEQMISRVTSDHFRYEHRDSAGGPYVFSWFVVDVVGYRDNPRRKAVGYHAVWDHYRRMVKNAALDCFGWHFHTVPVGGHALEYNTSWTNNDFHERALARRLIERGAFPSVFRAGGTIERNDLSWWLEQFIPFDFSSAAMSRPAGGARQLWDWRHAPAQWTPYHPDWYDYRRPGAMRRAIFRCLEIEGYETPLNESDVRAAFETAAQGQDVVLAYTDHDRRDLQPDVERGVAWLRATARDFPQVVWRFTNALEAARHVMRRPASPAPTFTCRRDNDLLWIESDQPLFGPTPFLAVHEEPDVFFRDNPTIEGPNTWAYAIPRPSRTRQIGIAGCNPSGTAGCLVFDTTG